MMKFMSTSAALVILATAAASQGAIVINEVYAGGGSSSASAAYKTDFVELYNNGTTAVSLAGYKVDYGSSSQAAGSFPTPIGTLPVGATIPAKGYYLIQTGSAGTGGAADVTPSVDFEFVNGVSGASLSNSSGGVRLTDNLGAILDVLGWGTANNFETTAETTPANVGVSMQRAVAGVDTNNNAVDFIQAAPTPTVPEPTTLAALGGVSALMLRRRR